MIIRGRPGRELRYGCRRRKNNVAESHFATQVVETWIVSEIVERVTGYDPSNERVFLLQRTLKPHKGAVLFTAPCQEFCVGSRTMRK